MLRPSPNNGTPRLPNDDGDNGDHEDDDGPASLPILYLLIYFPVFIILLHCTCICRQNKHYSDSDSDSVCAYMPPSPPSPPSHPIFSVQRAADT